MIDGLPTHEIIHHKVLEYGDTISATSTANNWIDLTQPYCIRAILWSKDIGVLSRMIMPHHTMQRWPSKKSETWVGRSWLTRRTPRTYPILTATCLGPFNTIYRSIGNKYSYFRYLFPFKLPFSISRIKNYLSTKYVQKTTIKKLLNKRWPYLEILVMVLF